MSDKKIKVCFVSPFAYGLFNPSSDLKFGGAEVQMYLISKELSMDVNFVVNFVVLDMGQASKMKYGKVNVYKVYKRGRGFLNLLKAPLILLYTLIKIDPDVVINRAFGVEVGIGRFYSMFFRKKFIYSIASDKDVDKSRFIKLRGKIFKYGFEKADYYIAQSQKQKEILEKTYKKKFDNLQVILNSYNLQKTSNLQKSIVLWVGSSMNLKRPELFLELAKNFSNEKFIMIMTKSNSNLNNWNKIEKLANKLSNLKLIEQVPFKKINNYFANAKIFINTSTIEGFPNTFLQAMMNKTPILSLKVDPDNFIINNECGLVCNDNYDKMIKKLNLLLENKELRKKMGENGFRYITKEHNIKKNIKYWKKLLTSI